MITVLRACLLMFAGCAALGMIPVALIAAGARRPVMTAVAVLIAACAAGVLLAAAAELGGPS